MADGALFKQEGYQLMAAAFDVYNEHGHGFGGDIYQESLEIELQRREIPFETQVRVPVFYKQERLTKSFVPDLLVMSEIIVELKAVQKLVPEHEAQLLNYLKASGKQVGYLINFGHAEGLEWKRMIRTTDNDRKSTTNFR